MVYCVLRPGALPVLTHQAARKRAIRPRSASPAMESGCGARPLEPFMQTQRAVVYRHLLMPGILVGFCLICPYISQALLDGNQDTEKKPLAFPNVIDAPFEAEVIQLAYSPKSKLLASAPAIYNVPRGQLPFEPIFIWDVPTGKRIRVLDGHGQLIQHLAFMPDGNQLISSAADGVILWDLVKGTANRNRYKTVNARASLTPSGKQLIHWDEKVDLLTWDTTTGVKGIIAASKEEKDGIKAPLELRIAVAPNERCVAVGAGLANHKIVIWNLGTGQVEAALSHASRLYCLLFSNTGKYLIAGGNELRKGYLGRGVLDIWETTGWTFVREIEMDENEVRPVWYFPKEDIILSVDNLQVDPMDKTRVKTFINGYAIKTGERVVSYDTKLPLKDWCTAAIYLEDFDAVCIGGATGKISFFSVSEIMKQKRAIKKPA
jgi:hypothetical protein